jgi:ankyrin repeat protein
VDREGRSAVYYTLVEGQTQLFEALVSAGANPKYHDHNGYGWMHTAAVRNYLMLPYVLRAGGSVNDVDPRFGMTPLMAVARGGDYHSIEWLIKHGAKVDAKDRKGETAYDYARRANTLRTDRFFREAVDTAQR